MPPAALQSMARRAGVSLDTAEEYWDQAKVGAKERGQTENWAYIMGIVKARLGLEDLGLARCGWPIRLIVEAEAPSPPEEEETKDYYFDVSDLDKEERGKLLRALREKNYQIIWQLLQGQTLCVPGLRSEESEELGKLLKDYNLKLEEGLADPHLVSLFLLEFYRVSKGHKSPIVQSDRRVSTASLMEQIGLLEDAGSYQAWLELLFPNCDPGLLSFIADQGARG